jgi:tetratricopeptide (TPR) repeat protein
MVIVIGTGQYGAAADLTLGEGQTSIKTMTLHELEVAGDKARAAKDYDQAIHYFEAALRKDDRNSSLYNKLGLARMRKGDLREAADSFQKSAKRDSKNADALNNLGAIYYMQNKYGGAAKQFKKAIALEETRAVFHVNLGAAWFGQKKMDRAVAEYLRALELDPTVLDRISNVGIAAQISTPEERAKFAYMMAKLYAQRGEADQCLHSLKKAKEEGYKEIANVYKDAEFASLRSDPRLAEIVPPPSR